MPSVFITGCSTGIGYACAKAFWEKGWRVLGSVRRGEDADRLNKDFNERFHPFLFDVTDGAAIEKAAGEAGQLLKDEGLNLLINNAGVAVSGPLALLPPEDLRYQFEVNLFGVLKTTQCFLPLLQQATGERKIMNISSVSGKMGFPFVGPYVASKHALEGLSQSLRRELMALGIDVILIAPGAVKTPIWEKDSAVKIPEKFDVPPWGAIARRFQKEMLRNAADGMEVEELARALVRIAEKNKPKTRYTFVKRRLKSWIIPRYLLSDRMLDRLLRKKFFEE